MDPVKRHSRLAVVLLAVCVAPVSSAPQNGIPSPLVDLASPAGPDAAFPQLASDGQGGVYMTWLETLEGGAGHRLRLAHRKAGAAWETPSTVHEGRDFWPNWADFPGLGVFQDGSIMVHWLKRSGRSTYDYDIAARLTLDGGRTWGDPFLVNTDGIKSEHGFVSFAATDKGMAVVWLDGRETAGGHEGSHAAAGGRAMTLRAAEFLRDGTRVREVLLDSRVCDCCQTAVVSTSKGLLAAYRDRSETELRDISLIRPFAAKAEPREFSEDGWKINACPVNGPALASRGNRVVAVWFTMAGRKARVRTALSNDGGDSFSAPVEVEAGPPLGRLDAALLPSGTALITWLSRSAGGGGEIKGALMSADGALRPPFKVTAMSIARAAGFPRVEWSGGEAVFAWTELQPLPAGKTGRPPSRVRTSVMKVP